MGIENIRKEDFLKKEKGRGRGHSTKLFKGRVRLDIAKLACSFRNRVCD